MDKKDFDKEVLAKVQPHSLAIAYRQAVESRQAAIEALTISPRNDILLLTAMAIHIRNQMETSHYDNINKYGKFADNITEWYDNTLVLLNKLNELSLKLKDLGMFKPYAAYLAKR
jgi:hypothetical protein